MPNKNEVLAICVGDMHWSLRAPLMHNAASWFATLENHAIQLQLLAKKYEAPIVSAGDVFDHFDEPAELLNHFLRCMPKFYSVAGNHELPNHRVDLITKSAYWCAVSCERIRHLTDDPWLVADTKKKKQLRLYGFSWGEKIKPPETKSESTLDLAVVHGFIWKGDFGHEGAQKKDHAKRWELTLDGFDAAVFGDNHKGFSVHSVLGEKRQGTIFNCGSFIRRKFDELDYTPGCGLLLDTGRIERVFFDTSRDVINDRKQAARDLGEGFMQELLDEISATDENDIDFEQVVRTKASQMKNRRLGSLLIEYLDSFRCK